MPQASTNCENRIWRYRETRRNSDYTYARSRSTKLKENSRLERGYDVAIHFVKEIASRRQSFERTGIEKVFREHADRWRSETGHMSSVAKMILHPSYLRIIGLGREGVPLILRELKARPDHWLVALNAITGEDPVPAGANFQEAVRAWIKWGESEGYC